MTVSAADLQSYVGASPEDAAYVEECLDEAAAMVGTYIGSQMSALVGMAAPDVAATHRAIIDRAIKEVGAELFNRRDAKAGIAQFATMDGGPVRLARDPMIPARAILGPLLGGGFA